MTEEKLPVRNHSVTVENRNKLVITGVADVADFDAVHVSAVTDFGVVTVRGEELKIGRLSVESGEITVEGTVDAVFYSEMQSAKKGFFDRILR